MSKYDEVLKPFMQMMEAELHANAGKGDRPGWLSMSADTCLLEIYYHMSKLQKSVKDGNGHGIREYAADVANMSMMLVDICGGLHLAAPAEDVRAVVEERTPQDYAIEHAGFLATAADQVLADYQAYTLAQMLADEGGDDGEAELTDAIDEARDDLHEGLRNLREMAYEFRKRRDRAIPQ